MEKDENILNPNIPIYNSDIQQITTKLNINEIELEELEFNEEKKKNEEQKKIEETNKKIEKEKIEKIKRKKKTINDIINFFCKCSLICIFSVIIGVPCFLCFFIIIIIIVCIFISILCGPPGNYKN
jgi:sorbitol-specific phosphotransferase system component IIBC